MHPSFFFCPASSHTGLLVCSAHYQYFTMILLSEVQSAVVHREVNNMEDSKWTECIW